jgi:hypothetical protein
MQFIAYNDQATWTTRGPMARTAPIKLAQRGWLIAEFRRLCRADPEFAAASPGLADQVNDDGVIEAMLELIEKGRLALVADRDGELLRLEWRQ